MANTSNYSPPKFSFERPTLKGSDINPMKEALKAGLSTAIPLAKMGFNAGSNLGELGTAVNDKFAGTGAGIKAGVGAVAPGIMGKIGGLSSKLGPWGVAAGAAVGAISGIVKYNQANKQRNKENTRMSKDYASADFAYQQTMDNNLMKRAATNNSEYFKSAYAKKGMKLPAKGKCCPETTAVDVVMKKLKTKHEQGGSIEKEKEKKDVKPVLPVLPPGTDQYNPKSLYFDDFNTQLTPEEEKEYNLWVHKESEKEGKDIRSEQETLDIKGYWKNNIASKNSANADKTLFRKPNHESFTIEDPSNPEEKPLYMKKLNPAKYYLWLKPKPAAEEVKSDSYKEGGRLGHYDIFMEKLRTEKRRLKEENVFRAGGAMNIIPKGVTHEQKNKMGDKGIPVVVKKKGGRVKKVAEVELNEIIFTKGVSEKIEELTDQYKKNPGMAGNLQELGKLVQEEIMYNTIDKQGEFLKN